jgi:hypothetical protein
MAAEPADATYRVVEIEIRSIPDQPPEPARFTVGQAGTLLPEPAALIHQPAGHTLYLARDPGTGAELAEPQPLFDCPCPLAGVRCGGCMMIAFAPPPFRATPLGWCLATCRRLWWRISAPLLSHGDDD